MCDTMRERLTSTTRLQSGASNTRPVGRDSRSGLEVAAWALFLSLALNTVSAAIVPLASEDNSLTIGEIRIADILVVVAIAFALPKGIPYGGMFVWGIVSIWAIWTMLAGLGIGPGDFSLYRCLAEWQVPVYLVATWLVLHSLLENRWSVWSRRTVRTQTALIAIASGWAAINGQAGADLATIGCTVAMLALATPRIEATERVLAILAALLLVTVAAQRAAILLSLVPLLVAVGIWTLKPNREKASNLLTTFFIVVSVLTPALLAIALDQGLYQRITQYVHHTFFREAKQLATESRLAQWHVALSDLQESPIFGQGIGGTVIRFRDPGIDRSAIQNITHNSLLDVTLRFGVPIGGLIIVMVAVLVAGRMVDAWKHGSFTLWICAWAVAGLLAKGMVESILFKPRLVPVLAVLVAILLFQRSRESGPIRGRGIRGSSLIYNRG